MNEHKIKMMMFAGLVVLASGCVVEPESDPVEEVPVAEAEQAETGGADTSCDASQDELAEDAPEDQSFLPGKQCWATCTVTNLGSGVCPATIGGYGRTTFLGGCGKACNKARGDAASKLPPDCVIYNCSYSGC